MIKLNPHQSDLVSHILNGDIDELLTDFIKAHINDAKFCLRKICRRDEYGYDKARGMNERQSREVLEAVVAHSIYKLNQRFKTATQVRQGALLKHMENIKAQCNTQPHSEINLSHRVTTNAHVQSIGAECMETTNKFTEYLYNRCTKSKNIGEEIMNTETLQLVRGRNVIELSEGKLIDVQNDVKEEIKSTEFSIIVLQGKLREAKDKVASLKDDVKIIGEHIKDKRNQNKSDS